MVCGNFILPEPASYVFFYAFFNLRNLLYIIILDALLSYCDDMDHNYDYETANDKRARSVAGPFIIYLAETILGPNHQSTNCH